MKGFQSWILVFLAIVLVSGCARMVDAPRAFWGSSTRALEEGLNESIHRSYQCDFNACFGAVLLIAEERDLEVFMKDEIRSVVVLMRIPGNIDTTEVGVFFTETGTNEVRLDITSLSSSAKRTASRILFTDMGERFTDVTVK